MKLNWKKLRQEQTENALNQRQQDIDNQFKALEDMRKSDSQDIQDMKTSAETFKIMVEGMGLDALIGPEAAQTVMQQIQQMQEQQAEIDSL
jgi:hypothetical protein